MKFRFIQYEDKIYVVRGIGYDLKFDPPEVFYCVLLEETAFKSLISLSEVKIPVALAQEITDKARLRAIWTLFGR